jgi:hypothetical protein
LCTEDDDVSTGPFDLLVLLHLPTNFRYLKLTEEPMKPSEEISDMTRQVKLRSSLIQVSLARKRLEKDTSLGFLGV